MTEFDLPDVDRFTAGAVGEPGQRVFYLQAVAGSETVTVRCEKTQVAALGEYLAQLLADLPAPDVTSVPNDLELIAPIDPVWIAGQIGVVFDESRDRMVVRVDEMPVGDGDEDDSATLVAAGRPPCPLCGRPIDPEGHMCIKTNGHHKH
jgi:uncharacterized repeat protein (TIGR03847 family)